MDIKSSGEKQYKIPDGYYVFNKIKNKEENKEKIKTSNEENDKKETENKKSLKSEVIHWSMENMWDTLEALAGAGNQFKYQGN